MPTFHEHVRQLQDDFNKLCERSNGRPDKREVQKLLERAGKALNETGYEEAQATFAELTGHNPWHICFAMALVWGHLAHPRRDFVGAAVRYLDKKKDTDLAIALRAYNERGPDPIKRSLEAARTMFCLVDMPERLPETLRALGEAQQRWLTPLYGPNHPPYMGNWNATGMFKMALFQNPTLAGELRDNIVYLPPGGPFDAGLRRLRRHGLLKDSPPERDEASFDWLAIAASNKLLMEIHGSWDGWSLLDAHSGVYMLGFKLPGS